ncbi:unnamed protein product [Lepidochelys olivacea]
MQCYCGPVRPRILERQEAPLTPRPVQRGKLAPAERLEKKDKRGNVPGTSDCIPTEGLEGRSLEGSFPGAITKHQSRVHGLGKGHDADSHSTVGAPFVTKVKHCSPTLQCPADYREHTRQGQPFHSSFTTPSRTIHLPGCGDQMSRFYRGSPDIWALSYIGTYYPPPPVPIFHPCYLVTLLILRRRTPSNTSPTGVSEPSVWPCHSSTGLRFALCS